MTVTVTSGRNASCPFEGTWESSMDGFTSPSAITPNVGAAVPQSISGFAILAAGTCTVFGVKYFLIQLSDGAVDADIDGVIATLAGGTPHTYAASGAIVKIPTGASGVPAGPPFAGLTFGGNTTGPTWMWTSPVADFVLSQSTTLSFPIPPVSFNCNCESASTYDTLANVRTKMLIRLGYPNQSANPPPGMALLIDQFLRDAQDEIYMQLVRASLRTQRFFKWTMVPGQRYYSFTDEEVACQLLNPEKVTWVGFEDLNQAWYRLDEGIPPEYYTRANINFGWPTRFELRSCIEIFPAPQAAYTLWIKGDFGVGALVADADRFTIDDKMVYLLALGNAKAHYGQKDAQLVLTQAGNMTKSIVAGAHGTRRYVPQSAVESPATPPRFLPLGGDQA